MINFNNNEYSLIISELINDAFYSELSNRGKISEMRQFSEVLVRKILNINKNRGLLLGKIEQPAFDKNGKPTNGAREEFQKLAEPRQKKLKSIIESFRSISNEATHTKHIEPFTDADLNSVTESLFDLYAFLFEEYFLKYPIDANTKPIIMYTFSLLPPVIRYKTLNSLFMSGQRNIFVADRLILAMLKTNGKVFSINWLNDNKKILIASPYPDNKLTDSAETNLFNLIKGYPITNHFELLLDKVINVSDYIADHGVMYQTFEEAVHYYKNKGIEDSSPEFVELKDIMDFVYIGRK